MTSHGTPLSHDVIAEASAWFIEFRDGEVPAATRARFNEWLRRSPVHIQAYLEVSASWSELPTSDPEGRLDVEALVARARASADDNLVAFGAGAASAPVTSEPRLARPSRVRLKVGAIAASLALLLVAAAVWLEVLRPTTYATGVGEQRTVLLNDGSTVELNALSTVQVRLSKFVRHLELVQGQALFHVAKDRARPFIVDSGPTQVRAVGTQFDVYRKASGTVVTVLEGEVAVLAPAREEDTAGGTASQAAAGQRPKAPGGSPGILLSAGEQITVTANQIGAPKKADTGAATAWTRQRLIFEATPLSDVAGEFNRYSLKKLVIADPELRTLGISGVYSSSDPESLIGFLRAQPTLEVTETADEILIHRRETH